MARTKSFNLRFSEEELEKLKAYAKSKELSLAEVIRESVKRLPNVKQP